MSGRKLTHSNTATTTVFLVGVFLGCFIVAPVLKLLSFPNASHNNYWSYSSNSIYNHQIKPSSYKNNLVLIGVMTAAKFLDTRAIAAYNTWVKTIPGKVIFFTSENSPISGELPVVRLHGVDDSYPPQKKSFMMLSHMWNNYKDDYQWFIRADDDVYIRGDKLETFLRSINSSKPLFIGQAGQVSIFMLSF